MAYNWMELEIGDLQHSETKYKCSGINGANRQQGWKDTIKYNKYKQLIVHQNYFSKYIVIILYK